ncbi:collagen-like protein [Streptomyces sp. NPDC059637]|uniref:collagen-like triple helix repeat-containing protein n=1 Tax=Streptomyces sp. NPDC059637 TaxID=3347752 RepID=UPI00367C8142
MSTVPPPPPSRCPGCGAPLPPAGSPAACPACALRLAGPEAAELWHVDTALARMDAERTRLLARRAQLLAALRTPGPPAAPGAAAPAPTAGPAAVGPARWAGPARAPRETSAPTVQNLLLALGGVLLAVAAVVFTVVSWGSMGIAGRAAVLSAVTLVALGTPVLLLRRGLAATAEVVACLALVLLFLDAYALHAVALPHLPGTGYAAGATAVLSAGWAGYGALTSRLAPAATGTGGKEAGKSAGGTAAPAAGPRARRGLRLPAPVAVCLAQLPLPLWALAAGADAAGWAAALLSTAAADTALAFRSGGRAVRTTATVTAVLSGGPALLTAAAVVASAGTLAGSARGGGLLLAGAAVALGAAWRLALRPQRAPEPPVPGAGVRPAPWQPPSGPSAPSGRTGAPGVPGLPGPSGVPGASGVPGTPWASGTAGAPGRWKAAGLPAGAPGASASAVAARLLSGTAGLAVLVACGGFTARLTPPGLDVTAVLGWAVALLAAVALPAVRAGLPRPVRGGLGSAAAAVHALCVLLVLPLTAAALLGPLSWAGDPWSGAPRGAARAFTSSGAAWAEARGWSVSVPVVLAVTAAVLAAARRFLPAAAAGAGPAAVGEGSAPPPGARAADLRGRVPRAAAARTAAGCGAVGFAAGAAGVLPVALDLPYAVAVVLLVALSAVALSASAVLEATGPARAASASGAVLAVTAAAWSLAERPMTHLALGLLLAVFAGTALLSPSTAPRTAPRTVGAPAAVLCAAGLAWAVPLGLGAAAHQAAFAVLAVAAAGEFLALRLRAQPAGPAVECAAGAVAALAVVLAAGDATALATVLALAGVVAGGVALREDRRRAAWAATALLMAASWVRLAAWDVEAPEAYTLPVTVPALVVGALRRRGDATASSWTSYGPGLSVTLLPSLAAAWGDAHWLRPLLLGVAALAVTLAGARHRLQAPLLLGGAVLALDVLHELAPYVVQVVDALPRWVVPALVGLLLLALGSRYEQRLRDARRVRAALGRMR